MKGCELKTTLLPLQSLLEVIQTRPILISLWILIGSVLGGLLLLALLVFCLWKVSAVLVWSRVMVPTGGGILDRSRHP